MSEIIPLTSLIIGLDKLGITGGGSSNSSGGGLAPIIKPLITSPASGTSNFEGAITSLYATSETFTGIQDVVKWRMATDDAFLNIVDSYDGAELLSWTPTLPSASTIFYVRVQQGSDNHISLWSNTLLVTSRPAHITTPIINVSDSPSAVGKNPTISGSAFLAVFDTDTHESTDWVVEDNGVVVWESLNDTVDLTSKTVPFNLSVSTTYTFKIRYKGVTLGYSEYSIINATTAVQFIPIDNYGNVYGTVTSIATGKKWLDRNLGVTQTQVATAVNDSAAYGSLFQWGRDADGHESRTSGVSSTISVQPNTPGHSDFITSSNDWTSGDVSGNIRVANWNPCPTGYRIPTEAEFQLEITAFSSSDTNGAFSALKLPAAGYRVHNSGTLNTVGSNGFYWSSTVSSSNVIYLSLGSSNADMYAIQRAYAFSVRCIEA